MRYAEIENGKVRYSLPVGLADDYKILPPNSVEIPIDSTVEQGDIYEDGKFRKPTPEELAASVPKEQIKFTAPLTDEQRDKILIELAYKSGIEPE